MEGQSPRPPSSYQVGWVEINTWRRWAGLAYKSTTGEPQFLVQNERDTFVFCSPVNFYEGSFHENSKKV